MELHHYGPFFRVLTAQNTLHTHSHTDGGIWGLGFWVHDDMQAGDSNQRQVICNFSQFNVFFYFYFFFFYSFFYSFYSTKRFLINTLQLLFRAIFILMYAYT